MKGGTLLWRVGHHSAPLEPSPRALATWLNRFDDPKKEFRTLYAAKRRETSLLETLWDWRPDAKTQADFQSAFPDSRYVLTQKVSREWLGERALARGRLEIVSGPLIDVEDLHLRNELQVRHAGLLHQHGFKHLNISVLRGPCREVTKAIGRDLYEIRGAAGLLYYSNVDNRRSVALFEGRARLEDTARVIPLLEFSGLNKVLQKLDLLLAPY